MTEFKATVTIVPNSTYEVSEEMIEFYNKSIRKILGEYFCFIPGDTVLDVRFKGLDGADWTDELPDEVATMLGRNNVPIESAEYCNNLRFPSLIPMRTLSVFDGFGHFINRNEDSINIWSKQVPYGSIKTLEEMLKHVTKR